MGTRNVRTSSHFPCGYIIANFEEEALQGCNSRWPKRVRHFSSEIYFIKGVDKGPSVRRSLHTRPEHTNNDGQWQKYNLKVQSATNATQTRNWKHEHTNSMNNFLCAFHITVRLIYTASIQSLPCRNLHDTCGYFTSIQQTLQICSRK